jgi:TRAP-type C4-dicarboxylate transport system substrate-binding protein
MKLEANGNCRLWIADCPLWSADSPDQSAIGNPQSAIAFRAWLILLSLCWSAAGALAAPMTVTLGTLAPEGTSYHRSLLEMREHWRKAPGGGVNVRLYAGGKLGGEAKMVSQMRLGALDAALLTATGLSQIEPAVTGLQSIPMMFHSLDEVDYIGEQLKPVLEKRMEKAGFVVLFWSDAGWVKFFAKQPMRTPEDLKKVKLFIWAGEPQVTEIWKSGGFQPVPLETADIVPMLDTGLINCVSLPPFAALATQIYSRAPHMLDLKWAPLTGALVVRKPVWDKIPAAAKDALLKAAADAGKTNKAQARDESEKSVTAMKEKGLTVHPVTSAMEIEWRKAAEVFYPKIKGTLVPPDIFDEVERRLKEYRAGGGSARP